MPSTKPEFEVIADQEANESHWRRQRRRHLTASDVFKFVPGDVMLDLGWWMEAWMGKDERGKYNNLNWVRRDVLTRKRTGAQPSFGDPVKALWGQKHEDHFRNLFADYSGISAHADHSLIKNPRWEYIAASLDSWGTVPASWEGLESPEMFVRPQQVEEAIRALDRDLAFHIEVKTTSDFGVSTWLRGKRSEPRSKVIHGAFRPIPPQPPVYNIAQGLTQMAIGGIQQNLFVVMGGLSNMTAHTVDMLPKWEKVLDRINEELAEEFEEIRKVVDAEK